MLERVRKEFTVGNALGLHARPATMLAKLASGFQSEIWLIREGEAVDAKSALAILMMAAGQGTMLAVEAVGADAACAIVALDELFKGKFGEE